MSPLECVSLLLSVVVSGSAVAGFLCDRHRRACRQHARHHRDPRQQEDASFSHQPLHNKPGIRRLHHHGLRSTGDRAVRRQPRLAARSRSVQVTALYPCLVSLRLRLDVNGRLH